MTVIDREFNEDKYHNELVVKILKAEIERYENIVAKDTEDKGHIHTTIRTLKERVEELSK